MFSCLLPDLSLISAPASHAVVLLTVLRIRTMAKLPERVILLPDSPVHWTLAAGASPWRIVDSGFWVSSAKVLLRRWWGAPEPLMGAKWPFAPPPISQSRVEVSRLYSPLTKALVVGVSASILVLPTALHLFIFASSERL